ncbi:hypothetical protein [Cellulomonas carbonis]|uniref:ABC transporter permease n=1 Tax=Cellulomonas carbonis T26 TaxID=947969 RepID=A0A0A0BSJ0_9CELL|nr:hypothetical protein [Cellulomonas carbonis]KGM10921.1 ABC transporter permease [Cellulomonas carbonis T26]GGC12978.1 hypothetical protein GCM10010972_27910 [Cellulomonas carbonis]
MTSALLARRFVSDHLRNPINLLVLVAVPVAFVLVAAGPLAEAGETLGTGGVSIDSITAGWAAGFIAGVGMYFQVSAARFSDRRLVIAGLPRATLVTGRLVSGGVLAGLASGSALAALAIRTGLDQPSTVVVGTALFAVIYLAVGAMVGSVVANPVNGTMLLLFVWILDVFFGPAMTGADTAALRVLPTHFVTLWIMGADPGHGGPDPLTWALVWAVCALLVAYAAVLRTSAVRRQRPPRRSMAAAQLTAGLRMAFRAWRRTPVLWVLLAAVPVVFIWLADAVTPSGSSSVRLREGGVEIVAILDPAHMHAGTMAPIAIGSLAALAGVFIGVEGRGADQRLVLAGQHRSVVLATRVGAALTAAALAVVASLAVTVPLFEAHQWLPYALGNALIAATFALIGVIVGPLVGRLSGALIAFLIPFLDLAIGQSPMLQDGPPAWARFLPGYGASRVVFDGALTETFDEGRALVVALGWIVGLLLLASVLIRLERASGPAKA